MDEAAGNAVLRERIVPAISSTPGFVSGTSPTGERDDRGLSLTRWTDAEHAQAFADQFGPGANPTAGAGVIRCELRDAAVTA